MTDSKIVQFPKQPSKVGQAVYDILSKPQFKQEVGETISEITPNYYQNLFNAINKGKEVFQYPFYVAVMRKKEAWALNVLKDTYIVRQTRPKPLDMRERFPNYDIDLFIAYENGDVMFQWTVMTEQDSKTILKNKDLYDPVTVKMIEDINSGLLV